MVKKSFFFLIAVIFLGLFLYFFKLESYPPSVHCDEILPAIFGQKIISGEIKSLIGVSWWSVPNVVFLPYGFSTAIFGRSVFSARFPSAVIGILSVISLFFLARLLFNQRVAVIASLLFSTSHWWIASARSGLINIQTVLPEILAFYFIFRGIKQKKSIFFVLAGFFTALGLYLYLNSRIVPFIILTIFIYQFFSRSNKVAVLKNLFIWLATTFLFFLPMLGFYYHRPDTFWSRSYIAFLFSRDPSSQGHMKSVYGTSNQWLWLWGNIKKALDLSTNYYDAALQYGYRGRALELLTLSFFLIGQLIAFFNFRKRIKFFFLLSWFWLTYIVFGILTHGVSLQRLIGLFPAVYLLTAVAIDQLLKTAALRLANKKFLLNLVYFSVALVLLTIMAKNLKIYFIDNPRNRLHTFTKSTEKKLSEHLQKLGHDYKVIFLTEPYLSPEWCLFPFLTPDLNAVSLKKGEVIPNISGPKFFIIWKDYQSSLKEIMSKYPDGELNQEEFDNVFIYKTRR